MRKIRLQRFIVFPGVHIHHRAFPCDRNAQHRFLIPVCDGVEAACTVIRQDLRPASGRYVERVAFLSFICGDRKVAPPAGRFHRIDHGGERFLPGQRTVYGQYKAARGRFPAGLRSGSRHLLQRRQPFTDRGEHPLAIRFVVQHMHSGILLLDFVQRCFELFPPVPCDDHDRVQPRLARRVDQDPDRRFSAQLKKGLESPHPRGIPRCQDHRRIPGALRRGIHDATLSRDRNGRGSAPRRCSHRSLPAFPQKWLPRSARRPCRSAPG